MTVGVHTHIHALNGGRNVSLEVFSPQPCSVFAELQLEEGEEKKKKDISECVLSQC